MADVVDKLSTVVYKSDLSEIMTEFGEPQIKRGYLILNGEPFKADFCKEYPEIHIVLKKSGGIFHDRFIVLDYGTEECRVFLCGASSKDAGARITTITEILTVQMYDDMVNNLINNPKLPLK